MVGYQIRLIGHLDFEAALLFFFLCADPAVGGNLKLSFFSSQVGQCAVCRYFYDFPIRHWCSLLFLNDLFIY